MKFTTAFTTAFFVFSLFLVSDTTASDSVHVDRIVIGKLECGRNITFKESKLEAGLALACNLSGRYRLIPSRESDSVAKQLRIRQQVSDSSHPPVMRVAQALASSYIVFARVDRLENIIRAEVQIATGDAFGSRTTGKGFALIRYRSEKKDEVVEDPAVLTALQRALCVALQDSMLYAKQQGVYNVRPAAPTVAGGMKFIDNPGLPPWQLFQNHTVNGFDVVVQVFDAMKDARDYVCYDVDSRDSIFAHFKLFLIENDNEPSRPELDALYKFEVQYYIHGTCRRTDAGAEIKMYFCHVNSNGTYSIIRTAQEFLSEDDQDAFRQKIKMLALSVSEMK